MVPLPVRRFTVLRSSRAATSATQRKTARLRSRRDGGTGEYRSAEIQGRYDFDENEVKSSRRMKASRRHTEIIEKRRHWFNWFLRPEFG